MTWQVSWTNTAKRGLRSLDPAAKRRVVGAVEAFAATGQGDVKKLQGEPGYRLRVGSYRVVFERKGETLTILVLRVGHRREVYR